MKAVAATSDKAKMFELPDGNANAEDVPVQVAMLMYEMTDLQYQAVYNVLSFSPASMMATTMYLWFRATSVKNHYASAVFISSFGIASDPIRYYAVF